MRSSANTHTRSTTQAAVVVGALGVVFGDIGTSPIYTVQTVFNPSDPHPVAVSSDSVYGIISLIFWSVMIIVLGGVYTITVLDIILALTGGGPANATQTIATQAYVVSFREFQFGQGAALSNILVVVSLLFALLYLHANRRVMAR